MLILYYFFIGILIERNRSPTDLVDEESELVSGFNVQYFGFDVFALIFIAEYEIITFFLFYFTYI